MRELTQAQMNLFAQNSNVLRKLNSYFKRRGTEEQIISAAERLAMQNFTALQVSEAVESILDLDDSALPSANEIRARISQPEKIQERSHQAMQDEENFKKNLQTLRGRVGEEGIQLYFRAWMNASGFDSEYFGVIGKSVFTRLAILDLTNANGKPEIAISKAKIMRMEAEKRLQAGSPVFENKRYLVRKAKSVRETSFTLKGA